MEENRKNEIVTSMLEYEFYSDIKVDNIDKTNYNSFPLTELTSIGGLFASVFNSAEAVTNAGGEGIYRVVFPKGVDGALAKFKDGSGYTASIMNKQIQGQARLIPVGKDPVTGMAAMPISPPMLFLTVALYSVNEKLDTIMDVQKEILSFLERDKESKLEGDLKTLSDVFNNYKYNIDNEKYISNKLALIQDIKRNAEQDIIFYEKQIRGALNKKQLFHMKKDLEKKYEKIQKQIGYYRLALYLYSFSTFIDVLMLGNFSSEYLNSIVETLNEKDMQYRQVYSECYTEIEKLTDTTVEAMLNQGLSATGKVIGKQIGKIPVINKAPENPVLMNISKRVIKKDNKEQLSLAEEFITNKNPVGVNFKENLVEIEKLYNNPMEMIFNRDRVYIGSL